MKKILLILFCILSLLFCSCKKIHEIENNKLVAACSFKAENNKVVYGFYITQAGGDSKDASGSENSLMLLEFTATNFAEALNMFNESGTFKTDLSHISFICADEKYYNDFFNNDEKHLRQSVPSSPLINCFIYDEDVNMLTECLNKEYKSKANNFSKALFQNDEHPYNCTLSELSLSKHNKFYTAIVPKVSILKNGDTFLPHLSGTALYSSNLNMVSLTDDEHNKYSRWQKKYSNESRGYKLSMKKQKINVSLKDKEILHIARKYAIMNVDVLNVKYYGRRLFTTYQKYNSFMNNLNLLNVNIN